MPVVIIDNFDSFTYNLYQLVQALTSDTVKVFRNSEITFKELCDMKPSRVILSPGPGHPGNDSDFGVCKEVIVNSQQLRAPILGVCLGHQGIVHHLGGKVVGAPEIVHGKSSRIEITGESPLFQGLPRQFEAMRYHSLVASEDTFPGSLDVTARESAGKLVMALQHKTLPLYGVQFHPESIGTPEGKLIMENFIERC